MSIDEAAPITPELPAEAHLHSIAEPYPSIKQSFGIVGIIVLMTLALSPLLLLAEHIRAEYAMLVYYSMTMGLSFYIVNGKRKRRLGTSDFRLRVGTWRLAPPIILGTVALLFGVITPLTELIPMPQAAAKAVQSMVVQTGPATLLYFVILAPVLEELIFRGIMLDGLLKRYGPLKAILISSLLFGLVHLNPWQFVTGFVLGCFFGWVYYRTGSVGCCILGHMTANGSGYILRLVMQAAGMTIQDAAKSWPSTATLIAVCALIILAVFFLRWEFGKDRYMVFSAVEPPPVEPGVTV